VVGLCGQFLQAHHQVKLGVWMTTLVYLFQPLSLAMRMALIARELSSQGPGADLLIAGLFADAMGGLLKGPGN